MIRFVLRRLLWTLPTLFLITFLVFIAIRIGTNPVQTATIGNRVTYTWYAGNVDVRNPINPYIPIELGREVAALIPGARFV